MPEAKAAEWRGKTGVKEILLLVHKLEGRVSPFPL